MKTVLCWERAGPSPSLTSHSPSLSSPSSFSPPSFSGSLWLLSVLSPVYQSSSRMAVPAHTVVDALFTGAPRTVGFTVSQTGPGRELEVGKLPSKGFH